MDKLKIASFFAGVGGIDLGFTQSGFYEVVYANEIDQKASETFNLNSSVNVDLRDIREIEPREIPDFDVLLAGFPCQPFSVAGYRKGLEDEHNGDLFFEILRILKAKRPQIIFLENVKNLISHDSGKTYKIIKESLEQNGYHIQQRVLNATEYGNIPQNRERIYIVGFQDPIRDFLFTFPHEVRLTNSIHYFIDFENKVDDKYYYTPDNFKHYELIKDEITNPNTIYQWRRRYVRENKSGVVPTLTANMGTGGHNVPLILAKHGIRKLTPRETFNIQGYPSSFKLPNQADSHLYKQAGNSVVVPVIKRIADSIAYTMDVDVYSKTVAEAHEMIASYK